MKNPFRPGDKKTFEKTVSTADTAVFEAGEVHPVYATFALGRDAEWVCRLFVLEMKDDDEEGIGTFLHVDHHSPALLNSTVIFEAALIKVEGNAITCSFQAKCGERLIASGETGQKIIHKDKLNRLFSSL